MTLGKKLVAYRKLSGLTQQQLGEKLNLSAQAISKWENDLAEPDLSALRTLATLYAVSVDELLDLDSMPSGATEEASDNKNGAEANIMSIVGFCKDCGVTVTEENLGETEPVILCKKCLENRRLAKAEEERRRIEKEKAEALRKQEEERKHAEMVADIKKRTKSQTFWHSVLAALAVVAFIIIGIKFSFPIPFIIIAPYIIFSYVFCVSLETLVQFVFLDWSEKTIQLPGIIFTLDFDGCAFLITTKILFWIIGVLFGIVVGAFGIILGIIIAPFYFPYVMYTIIRDFKLGEENDYLDYPIYNDTTQQQNKNENEII